MILSDSMLCESLQWFCVTMKFFQMLKVAADLPNTLPPTLSISIIYINIHSLPCLFRRLSQPALRLVSASNINFWSNLQSYESACQDSWTSRQKPCFRFGASCEIPELSKTSHSHVRTYMRSANHMSQSTIACVNASDISRTTLEPLFLAMAFALNRILTPNTNSFTPEAKDTTHLDDQRLFEYFGMNQGGSRS